MNVIAAILPAMRVKRPQDCTYKVNLNKSFRQAPGSTGKQRFKILSLVKAHIFCFALDLFVFLHSRDMNICNAEGVIIVP